MEGEVVDIPHELVKEVNKVKGVGDSGGISMIYIKRVQERR